MKKSLVMKLFSEPALEPGAAREQIQAISDFEGGLFRPERCDLGEPIREKFDPKNLSEPVRWLTAPGGGFAFRRTKPFRVHGFIENRRRMQLWAREHKGAPTVPVVPKFPEPRFLSRWVVWLDWRLAKAKGPDFLEKFLVDMFLVSRAEYGLLTTEEDQEAKNYVVVDNGRSVSSQLVGVDPEHGIPGLYWCNALGSVLTEWLGAPLANVPGTVVSLKNGCTVLRFGDSPEESRTPHVLSVQQQAIDLLGREKFFDIREPKRKVMSPFLPRPLKTDLVSPEPG